MALNVEALLGRAPDFCSQLGISMRGGKITGAKLLGGGSYAKAYHLQHPPFEGQVLKVTGDAHDARLLAQTIEREVAHPNDGVWPRSKPLRGLVRVLGQATLLEPKGSKDGAWAFVLEFAPPMGDDDSKKLHPYMKVPSPLRDLLLAPEGEEWEAHVNAALKKMEWMAQVEEAFVAALPGSLVTMSISSAKKASTLGDASSATRAYFAKVLPSINASVFGAYCDLYWAWKNIAAMGGDFYDWHPGNIGVVHQSKMGPGHARDALVIIDMGHHSANKFLKTHGSIAPSLPRARNRRKNAENVVADEYETDVDGHVIAVGVSTTEKERVFTGARDVRRASMLCACASCCAAAKEKFTRARELSYEAQDARSRAGRDGVRGQELKTLDDAERQAHRMQIRAFEDYRARLRRLPSAH